MPYLLTLLVFGYYPYVALTVFIAGSIIRFNRGQFGWRSGSSELLRKRELVLGSTLFHYGILVVLAGHLVGFATPDIVLQVLGVSVLAHQLLAVVAGGLSGSPCLDRPYHAGAPQALRFPDPKDLQPHGHLRSPPGVGAAHLRPGHDSPHPASPGWPVFSASSWHTSSRSSTSSLTRSPCSVTFPGSTRFTSSWVSRFSWCGLSAGLFTSGARPSGTWGARTRWCEGARQQRSVGGCPRDHSKWKSDFR